MGYGFGKLMVNVQPTNDKLVDRGSRIIQEIAGVSYEEASRLLDEGGSVRTAVVMNLKGVSREQAEQRLADAKGRLRIALADNNV